MIAEALRTVALTFILAGILSGCSSVKIPEKTKADFVEIFNSQNKALLGYELLDGKKENLKFLFKSSKADSILNREEEKLYIDLYNLNSEKILLNLRNQYGDSISREFKGQFETDMFKFRTKWFISGNPLIWVLGSHDNILAKNSSGELVLYHTREGLGFLTLIPFMGASNGMDIYKFKN